MTLTRSQALALPPILLWVVSVALLVRDAVNDPYDPALEGTKRYGHNSEGILGSVLPLTVVELLVTLAVLQPWKETHRGWRALGLLVALVPWTLMSLLMTMHAGGVIALHGVWLTALVVLVAVYGAARSSGKPQAKISAG